MVPVVFFGSIFGVACIFAVVRKVGANKSAISSIKN
jgi:hypothetical protein